MHDEDDLGLASCVLCRGGELSLSEQPCGPGCCEVACPWCSGLGILVGDGAGVVTDACGHPLRSATAVGRFARGSWVTRWSALDAAG